MTKQQGIVTLVGAGPGDAELITLKAAKALQDCEVIVYDRLANPELIDLNPEAELIFVGKEQGRHLVAQDKINDILLQEALKGKKVVRLKGGDPFLFGRGSEERDYLKEHGIEVQVIPGISSSLAVPASVGIPVTARGVASAVHIVTGHAKKSGPLICNYAALAQAEGTLIFMMAVASAREICAKLIEAGLDEETPAAFIQDGTLESQKVVKAELKSIADAADEAGIESPAILIIGEVCNLQA